MKTYGKRDLYLYLKEKGYNDEAKWLHKTKIWRERQVSLKVFIIRFKTWAITPQGHEFWSKLHEDCEI